VATSDDYARSIPPSAQVGLAGRPSAASAGDGPHPNHEWTMAEATEDLITREWWLLADVLAFVMDVGRLEPPEAENLLLDYAWMGWFDDFRWHEAGARVVLDLLDSLPGSSPTRPVGAIHPRQWGRRDLRFGTEDAVQWPHSRVVHRLTSPAPTVTAQEIHELLVPFRALPDGHTMHVVRLRGIDVIAMLRHAGLLTREEEIALLRAMGFLPDVAQAMTEEMETETETEEMPGSEETETEETKTEEAPPKPLTPEQKVLVAIILRHHPHGFSVKPNFSVLARSIAPQWAAECKRQGIEAGEPPNRDTVRRTLRQASLFPLQS